VAHRRIDAAGRFVVFQNLIGPPRKTYGLKAPHAFALILKQCGYQAIWGGDVDRLTLHFQQSDGRLAPISFERRIEFTFELDKDLLMTAVFENGLKGWLALPADKFAIVHSMAEQELRNGRI
jgi:hypothetical protein